MLITWDDVIVGQKAQVQRFSTPVVSVFPARLSFNAAVCSLIDNIYQYEWVNVKQGTENGRIVKLALEFDTDYSEHSFRILQKVLQGKKVSGLNLYSKSLIDQYFPNVTDRKSKKLQLPVEKMDDNTIVINLNEYT